MPFDVLDDIMEQQLCSEKKYKDVFWQAIELILPL
jgi:hypothetical protein